MDNRFEERYRSGDTPWDHGLPDPNLIDMVSLRPIPPCRALDIGCGTGDNAIWLASRGFSVIGCDIATTAIEAAQTKAATEHAACTFLRADFMKDAIPGGPFGFVLDRGCLHAFRKRGERKRFARNVAAILEDGGLWLTLAGNADEPEREVGPPRLTAEELVSPLEPGFEILSLKTGFFNSEQPDPPRAWICLMRKRT